MMTAEPYSDYMFKHFSGFYDIEEQEPDIKCTECNGMIEQDQKVWDDVDKINRCPECDSQLNEN